MTTTLELLKKPHSEAVKMMIEEQLDGAQYEDLHVEDGYVRSDQRSGYLIKSHPNKANDVNWHYHGDVVFTHYRIRLQDFFYGLPLKLKVPSDGLGGINTTSNHVVFLLSQIYDIKFDPLDYYSDVITASGMITYTLNTTPSSLRWSGSIDIDLYPDI